MTTLARIRPRLLACVFAGSSAIACGAPSADVAVPGNAASTQPVLDGAALYGEHCASCHGDSKKHSAASATQGAIDNNMGGMGRLKTLTPAQVAAIAVTPR